MNWGLCWVLCALWAGISSPIQSSKKTCLVLPKQKCSSCLMKNKISSHLSEINSFNIYFFSLTVPRIKIIIKSWSLSMFYMVIVSVYVPQMTKNMTHTFRLCPRHEMTDLSAIIYNPGWRRNSILNYVFIFEISCQANVSVTWSGTLLWETFSTYWS